MAKKDQTKGLLGLILNIIIPGLGGLVVKENNPAIIQLILWIIAIVLDFTFIGAVIGIPLGLIAWIWSIITGIKIYKKYS